MVWVKSSHSVETSVIFWASSSLKQDLKKRVSYLLCTTLLSTRVTHHLSSDSIDFLSLFLFLSSNLSASLVPSQSFYTCPPFVFMSFWPFSCLYLSPPRLFLRSAECSHHTSTIDMTGSPFDVFNRVCAQNKFSLAGPDEVHVAAAKGSYHFRSVPAAFRLSGLLSWKGILCFSGGFCKEQCSWKTCLLKTCLFKPSRHWVL